MGCVIVVVDTTDSTIVVGIISNDGQKASADHFEDIMELKTSNKMGLEGTVRQLCAARENLSIHSEPPE